MNLDEIKSLIDLVTERDISEFELERDGEKIRICRASSNHSGQPPPYIVVSSAAPVAESPAAQKSALPRGASPPAPEAPEAPDSESEDLVMVPSPIVGTFFEAASPGAPPFVQVGDRVEPGQVLCIIEAMKLMNEIEAEVAGVIVKRFAQNAQPVEYGEALFAVKSNA